MTFHNLAEKTIKTVYSPIFYMDIVQTRLFELWEYCEHLQTRVFNLERQIQAQIAKGYECVELKEEVLILREHYKRARHRAESFKERHWSYRLSE